MVYSSDMPILAFYLLSALYWQRSKFVIFVHFVLQLSFVYLLDEYKDIMISSDLYTVYLLAQPEAYNSIVFHLFVG